MALVPRSSPSIDASGALYLPQIPDLLAGEAIDAGAACYIAAANGKVWMCDGTAADEKAVLAGFAARAAGIGQPVTLFGIGNRMQYDGAGGLTPGALYYVAATAGRLDTAATVGGTRAVAQAVDTKDIRIVSAI